MIWKKGAERPMSERLYNLLARFGGNIGFVGSGIHCLSSQSLSKSSKNWFEKRTSGGTVKTAKQLRKQRLAVFFFSTLHYCCPCLSLFFCYLFRYPLLFFCYFFFIFCYVSSLFLLVFWLLSYLAVEKKPILLSILFSSSKYLVKQNFRVIAHIKSTHIFVVKDSILECYTCNSMSFPGYTDITHDP